MSKSDHKISIEEYDAVTRTDFWVFVLRVFAELTGEPFEDNFHIQLLCGELDRIRTERDVRLAVALPPRSLKSIIVSVALPAWLLGHDPSVEIICVSYGQELADKLSNDCRRIMLTPWYRRLFPSVKLDRSTIANITTTMGGSRYATSVGGTLTGLGADVILVDDPMKPDEALSDAERTRTNNWAQHTLFTRMNDKKRDKIVLVMQRLHEDDMIGHVLALVSFELLAFPAIAIADEVHIIRTPFGTIRHERKEGTALHPEREPLETLNKQRQLLGNAFFSAQYQQMPTPPGGGLIKIDWFQRFDSNHPPHFVKVVQSWDCASKVSQLNDYSVCTTWGVTVTKKIYLLHIMRERLEYPELKRKVRQLSEQWRAGFVLIEDTAAGIQLIQELKREGPTRIVPIKPRVEKAMRVIAQTAAIEAGRVYLPYHAPWLHDLEHELAMFPKGRHDDQVDSTSQALAYIGKPNNSDGLIEYYRSVSLEKYGISPEQLTVIFDHQDANIQFSAFNGREIIRGEDGFYHATSTEWELIKICESVTLVDS